MCDRDNVNDWRQRSALRQKLSWGPTFTPPPLTTRTCPAVTRCPGTRKCEVDETLACPIAPCADGLTGSDGWADGFRADDSTAGVSNFSACARGGANVEGRCASTIEVMTRLSAVTAPPSFAARASLLPLISRAIVQVTAATVDSRTRIAVRARLSSASPAFGGTPIAAAMSATGLPAALSSSACRCRSGRAASCPASQRASARSQMASSWPSCTRQSGWGSAAGCSRRRWKSLQILTTTLVSHAPRVSCRSSSLRAAARTNASCTASSASAALGNRLLAIAVRAARCASMAVQMSAMAASRGSAINPPGDSTSRGTARHGLLEIFRNCCA